MASSDRLTGEERSEGDLEERASILIWRSIPTFWWGEETREDWYENHCSSRDL